MKKILIAALALCPVALLAQEIKPFDAKPGLWEHTSTVEITGMPPMPAMPQLSEEQLSKMPAQQRAQIEAMMKGRGSMGSPRVTTTKSCVTREQLAKPLYQGDKNCTAKLVSSSSSTQQVHVDCNQNNMKTSGDMTLERVDAEHFKASGVMKMSGDASRSGDPNRSMDVKMALSARFLSSDCGDVKPAGDK